MFRHNFINKDNCNILLRFYFGNGKYKDIDFKNQHSFEVYDKFKVDVYRKNECEIEFKEGIEICNDDNNNLYIKYDDNDSPPIYNVNYNEIVEIFDKITNYLK